MAQVVKAGFRGSIGVVFAAQAAAGGRVLFLFPFLF
jgi:hypothetical protein